MASPAHAFLSYSRQDADFAGFFRLVLGLALPDLELWMDDRLGAGERYPDEIRRQVDTCTVFFVAVSSAWRQSEWCRREIEQVVRRKDPAQVVPLLLEDVRFDDTAAGAFQAVDLRRWRIDGDAVLQDDLFVRLGAPSTFFERPAGLEAAMRSVVLWAARSRTPDREGRHIADLASWHASMGGGKGLERARLLDALAGLHLTRREWRDMIGATQAALALLAEAGWHLPSPDQAYPVGERTDRDLAFLGELYNRLALGARQLKDRHGRHHVYAALAAFNAIRQPLSRREKTAQTLRELGTWDQWCGDLTGARRSFEESGHLLAGLPSQRFHVYQAKIKMAQVDIARGDVARARRLLDEVVDHFAPEAQLQGLLAHQVLPHFLRTEVAYAAVVGDDVRAHQALTRLARVRDQGGGGRNRVREAALHALLLLPTSWRQSVVRAAGSGGFRRRTLRGGSKPKR